MEYPSVDYRRKWYVLAAVSPDGTHLLAVEVEKPKLRLWLNLIDLETKRTKRITGRPGLWVHPVWR